MVTITANGRRQEFEGFDEQGRSRFVGSGEWLNVEELLFGLIDRRWSWEIDHSEATDNELAGWLTADLRARFVCCAEEGRPVHFLGKVYTEYQEAEDAIAESGFHVRVARDNESGLYIDHYLLPEHKN